MTAPTPAARLTEAAAAIGRDLTSDEVAAILVRPLSGRLLTPGQVGRMLRVNAATVTAWAKTGRLEYVLTEGGHHRIPESAVRALFETTEEN